MQLRRKSVVQCQKTLKVRLGNTIGIFISHNNNNKNLASLTLSELRF